MAKNPHCYLCVHPRARVAPPHDFELCVPHASRVLKARARARSTAVPVPILASRCPNCGMPSAGLCKWCRADLGIED